MGFRREERIPLRVPTTVWGMEPDGTLFVEQARTLDISPLGARLAGLRRNLELGAILGLQHGTANGRFRVVWVGEPGTDREGQIGVSCVEVGQATAKTLLYIGVEDLAAERHRRALDTAGYRVICVPAEKGAEVLQAQPFDAAVLDHTLLGSGLGEVIGHVREQCPNVRLLVLSTQPGNIPESALRRADALLHKGVDGRELLARVEELIGPGTQLKWPLTRLAQRYPVAAQVQVKVVRHGAVTLCEGRSSDMSEEGIGAVLPGAELVVGEIVSLRFHLPTTHDGVSVYGIVRHRAGEHYGIEFTDLSDAHRGGIRTLCQVLPPLTAPRP